MFKKQNQNLPVIFQENSENNQAEPGWLSENNDEGELLLDVYQDKNNIYVQSAMAGVKPEDLSISLNNDLLTIRGSRRQSSEVEENDYFYQECYWGNFSRSIVLPTQVKADKISATLKNGVLIVKLPKLRGRSNIPIEVSEE
ncbi:MAG TPA: Hsp20/alpha crystallin family protein [Patescibacteria group bacterium]|nr:Hsp20/alpha crystallin family protein [Patescibacteria group bacterium]